jgi:hypothetical protein
MPHDPIEIMRVPVPHPFLSKPPRLSVIHAAFVSRRTIVAR